MTIASCWLVMPLTSPPEAGTVAVVENCLLLTSPPGNRAGMAAEAGEGDL